MENLKPAFKLTHNLTNYFDGNKRDVLLLLEQKRMDKNESFDWYFERAKEIIHFMEKNEDEIVTLQKSENVPLLIISELFSGVYIYLTLLLINLSHRILNFNLTYHLNLF